MILKEIPRNTASFKLVRFRPWIIKVARLTSEMFSHTSPSKRVSAIFHMGFFLQPPQVWYHQCRCSFLQKRPSELVLCCSTLHLFNLQIFFTTMPQEARKGKSQGGTSMRATPRASEFLKIFCSNTPLPGPKSCSNAPLGGGVRAYFPNSG